MIFSFVLELNVCGALRVKTIYVAAITLRVLQR
jgi:hypothetical protein